MYRYLFLSPPQRQNYLYHIAQQAQLTQKVLLSHLNVLVCPQCAASIYAIPRSTFYKAKARVTSGGANVIGKRLHKTGVSSFVKHTFASALNALCSETATYRPDKPHRVVPFRTWAQVLAHVEEKLQMSMPASTFRQLRKWPSCHDIRRLRTTEHSKCDTCTRLNAAIERCPGAIERARLQQELREHLRLCAAQRTTFYEHNTKAM